MTNTLDTTTPEYRARLALSVMRDALDDAITELIGGDVTGSIEALATATCRVDDATDWLVLAAREEATSWGAIAEALGTSRQNAHQRFASLTLAVANGGAVKWREPRLAL